MTTATLCECGSPLPCSYLGCAKSPKRVCSWCTVQPASIHEYCVGCWYDLNDAAGAYDDEETLDV